MTAHDKVRDVYVLHRKTLRRWLRHQFRRHREEDLADALHEAFLRACVCDYTLSLSIGQLRVWVFRTARNQLLNSAKRERRLCLAPYDEAQHTGSDTHSQLETAIDTMRYWNRMNAEAQTIFLLVHEGYSAVEIARLLGRKPESIYKRVYRERARLRRWASTL